MRLMIWLVVAFSLCACAELPERPDGELCTLDMPRSQGICASMKEVKSVEEIEHARGVIMLAAENRKLPIVEMDKYICFSPDTWQNVSVYIKQLKEIAQRQCNQ